MPPVFPGPSILHQLDRSSSTTPRASFWIAPLCPASMRSSTPCEGTKISDAEKFFRLTRTFPVRLSRHWNSIVRRTACSCTMPLVRPMDRAWIRESVMVPLRVVWAVASLVTFQGVATLSCLTMASVSSSSMPCEKVVLVKTGTLIEYMAASCDDSNEYPWVGSDVHPHPQTLAATVITNANCRIGGTGTLTGSAPWAHRQGWERGRAWGLAVRAASSP